MEDELSSARDALVLCRLEAEEAVLEREEAEEKYGEVVAALAEMVASRKKEDKGLLASDDAGEEQEQLREALVALKQAGEKESEEWSVRHLAAEVSGTAAIDWGVEWREAHESELFELRERSADLSFDYVERLAEKNAMLAEREESLKMRVEMLEEELELCGELDEAQSEELRWLSQEASESVREARLAREEASRIGEAAKRLGDDGDSLREWAASARIERDAALDRAAQSDLRAEQEKAKGAFQFNLQEALLVNFVRAKAQRIECEDELDLLLDEPCLDALALLELSRCPSRIARSLQDSTLTAEKTRQILADAMDRFVASDSSTIALSESFLVAEAAARLALPNLETQVAMQLERQLSSIRDDSVVIQQTKGDNVGSEDEALLVVRAAENLARAAEIVEGNTQESAGAAADALADALRSALRHSEARNAEALARLTLVCERDLGKALGLPSEWRKDDVKLRERRNARRERQRIREFEQEVAVDSASAAAAASEALRVSALRDSETLAASMETNFNARIEESDAKISSLKTAKENVEVELERLNSEAEDLRRELKAAAAAKEEELLKSTTFDDLTSPRRTPKKTQRRSPRRYSTAAAAHSHNANPIDDRLLNTALGALLPPLPSLPRANASMLQGDEEGVQIRRLLAQARDLKKDLLASTEENIASHAARLVHLKRLVSQRRKASTIA